MTRTEKKIVIGAAMIVTALAILVLLNWPADHELVYKGKTLTEWVIQLDSQTEHQAQNEEAQKAFQAMGKDAIPGLVRILHKRADPPIVAKVKEWAMRFRVIHPPTIRLADLQYRAARACCVLGGWSHIDIRAAIPDLAYALTNKVSGYMEPFAWGLVYSGPEGLSVITNVMATDPSPQVREAAAHSLWISKEIRTPEIAGALVAATRDPNANVRVMATLSLRSFSRDQTLAGIIALGTLRSLQDTNAQVRRWAVALLSDYTSFPEVATALTNMLNDPHPAVRAQAEKLFQTKSGGAQRPLGSP